MNAYLLVIDQGTTSSRAIVFDDSGTPRWSAQQEFRQIFPHAGWVEHDPEDIWRSTLSVCREVLSASALDASEIAGIGITNQRETVVVWDRATGAPVYNAIVWQDRRTADACRDLAARGLEPTFARKTGLLLDPYFSGTKLRWIIDSVDGARRRAENGELAFGTVDTFLLWRLTGGRTHVTDATNASRTLLFDIHEQQWDRELVDLLDIPPALLPEVSDCTADFGHTEPGLLGGAVPVRAMVGDQQAALFGQACFDPGAVKSTYGTGCFMVMNTGGTAVTSRNRLLTTVGYRLGGEVTFALEGSIFMAGATIQWLRDGLGVIGSAAETGALAASASPGQSVTLVPAFTGLGAPYWDPDARGAIFGLTRDTGVAELVRAGLESVVFQTRDLLEAMRADGVAPLRSLRVDGGMVVNDWLLQRMADALGVRVDRPRVTETTALGAAFMAGLQSGVFGSQRDVSDRWQRDAAFEPGWDEARRDDAYRVWREAVARVRTR